MTVHEPRPTERPAYDWEPQHRAFLDEHLWAVLATGRHDGSPQQSMIGYTVDEAGRLLISAKSYTSKWRNTQRQPRVSITVPDGREHLVIYGTAETIEDDPERAELTAAVFTVLMSAPVEITDEWIASLDDQQRTILRITPTKTAFHP